MVALSRALLALPFAAAACCMAAGACGAFEPSERIALPAMAAGAAIDRPATHSGVASGVVTRAADGLFYLDARINHHRVRFLVDTGASVVVLTAADAAAIGASPTRGLTDGELRTVGGRTTTAWTHLDEVAVGGRRVRGVRAAVVHGGLGVSLMGQNLLARLGPMRIDGDRLQIG